jgi:hypothetical protein
MSGATCLARRANLVVFAHQAVDHAVDVVRGDRVDGLLAEVASESGSSDSLARREGGAVSSRLTD